MTIRNTRERDTGRSQNEKDRSCYPPPTKKESDRARFLEIDVAGRFKNNEEDDCYF